MDSWGNMLGQDWHSFAGCFIVHPKHGFKVQVAVAAKSTASVWTFPSYTTQRPSIHTWLTFTVQCSKMLRRHCTVSSRTLRSWRQEWHIDTILGILLDYSCPACALCTQKAKIAATAGEQRIGMFHQRCIVRRDSTHNHIVPMLRFWSLAEFLVVLSLSFKSLSLHLIPFNICSQSFRYTCHFSFYPPHCLLIPCQFTWLPLILVFPRLRASPYPCVCVCVLVVRFAWLHIISVFHYYTYCYINCFELGLEAGKMEEPQKHHPARGVWDILASLTTAKDLFLVLFVSTISTCCEVCPTAMQAGWLGRIS